MSRLHTSSSTIRALSVLLCAGAGLGFVAGCVLVNTEHCGYKQNGADNPCPEGYVCSVCAVENNGCVPLDQKDAIQQACLDSGTTAGSTLTATDATGTTDTTLTPPTGTTPTSGDPSTGTDTTAIGTTSANTSDTSSTTGPVGCDPRQVVTDQCSPDYCLPSGVCGDCTQFAGEGTSCDVLFPDKPVCDDATGVCAECSAADSSHCSGATPVCDAATGTCVACTEHFQCPAACDIETGMCFPEEERVYHVRGSQFCLGNDGSVDKPFCTLNQVPLDPGQPTTIKIMPSMYPPGALAVPEGAVVAVVRAGDQLVDIDGAANLGGYTIRVSGADSRAYVYRLNFRYAPDSVLRCENGARLWVHDSRIEGNDVNDAVAIDGTGCDIEVVRSVIRDCGAGIRVTDGDLRVDSSFLLLNGLAQQFNPGTFGAFSVLGTGPRVRISYSTILQNQDNNMPSVFHCEGGPWDVLVRNSAVLGVAPAATDGCAVYDGGMMHEAIDVMDEATRVGQWFTPFPGSLFAPKDTQANDPLEGTATWEDGDPLLDFNRQPIPQGVSSWAGAIQPP